VEARLLEADGAKAIRITVRIRVCLSATRTKDEVFHWLEKAYDDHVPKLVRIQQDSDLNSLHDDPRFQALVKRIGLPPSF